MPSLVASHCLLRAKSAWEAAPQHCSPACSWSQARVTRLVSAASALQHTGVQVTAVVILSPVVVEAPLESSLRGGGEERLDTGDGEDEEEDGLEAPEQEQGGEVLRQ